MRQIYNFEEKNPPVLNEAMLRSMAKKRRVRRQTTVLALAGILMQFCLLLAAFPLYGLSPVLAAAAIVYSCGAVAGAGVIALVYVKKRRAYTCIFHL